MSSTADWQDYTNWMGVPLFAGNFAITGALTTFVTGAAVGAYKSLLCYVSPGGASAVQMFYNYTLADTGAGVVVFSRSVVCPPGQTSFFTVPNLTNQVQIRALSNANVSADVAVWPTNQQPAFGFPVANGSLFELYAHSIGSLVTETTNLPVFAGRVKLALTGAVGGFNVVMEQLGVNAAGQGRLLVVTPTPANGQWDVNLPLGWNTIQIGNPTGGALTISGSIVPDIGV